MRSLFRLLVLFLGTLSFAAPAQIQTAYTVPAYALPAYGPFVLVDERTVALVGGTDWRSPATFRALLRDHPNIALLIFVECPGTRDDASNLALGRMIRAARLDAYVPPWASVRSGAVDLLLASEHRQIDDGARFAVHAWRDARGNEANDFAANSPVHRKYLTYYREMGMSANQAAAFYAMTNSAPHENARLLTAPEMRAWIASDASSPQMTYRTGFQTPPISTDGH